MTAITQPRPSAASDLRSAAGPCLTDAPSADRVIGVLFAVTVTLFLLGLLALAL